MDFNHDLHAKVTVEELKKLQESCMELIRKAELYNIRNDAKLRAVYSTQTYNEFKNIVDAAHLKPITRKDKNNARTKNRLWNTSALNEDYNCVDD